MSAPAYGKRRDIRRTCGDSDRPDNPRRRGIVHGLSRLYSLVRFPVKNAHMASVASGPRGSVKEPNTDPPDHA
jgi:hypothetical protein